MLTATVIPHAHGQAHINGPDFATQVMLIRHALTMVDQGNQSGNYTVLRDLASAQFRQRYTASDLADAFRELRHQQLDLMPVLVTEPQIAHSQVVAPGRWEISGVFSTHPQQIHFALVFVSDYGRWTVDEIAVRVAPPPAQQTAVGYRQGSPNANAYHMGGNQPPQAGRFR